MKQYLDLLRDVLDNGVERSDRTGVGTRALFGRQVRYDLNAGFPLLTTKRLHKKSIVHELLWFLQGQTNVSYLNEHGVSIWNEWADDNGDLGSIYGKQWRRWEGTDGQKHDQISFLVDTIKNEPHSRRMILSAWNVGELSAMKLTPCHVLCQVWVNGKKLNLQLYQRSADLFLGVPFNIASYALLLEMLAHVCDLEPGEFIHTFGDVHLYSNHLEQARIQLGREPRELPQLRLNPEVKDIFKFQYDDIAFLGYNPHPHIAASVAV